MSDDAPAAPVAPTAIPAFAGEFLLRHLSLFESRIAEIGPRLLSPSDDRAVHDLRVALRRTRTLLEVGRPVLGRFHADEVRAALRDVQRASGVLRDEEVLLEILTPLTILGAEARPEVSASVTAWIDARRRRERRLRSGLRRTIRQGELERGRRLLAALIAFRTKPSRDRRLTKFARRAVEDARREVERRRAGPLLEPEALHRLRIAYKRLRYTVEAFASVLAPELAGLAQPAARFQGRLGKLHDVDMVIACVKTAPNLPDAARDALIVELEPLRQDRVAAFEKDHDTAPLVPAAVQAAP
ncbi:MAG TPA: CHAD domain-containing protein [Polyangiaceae bacterium]